MKLERMLRLVAGLLVLASLGLAYFYSRYWLLFTAFVGLSLFQSGFTNWRPMKTFLQWAGMKSCEHELEELTRKIQAKAATHV